MRLVNTWETEAFENLHCKQIGTKERNIKTTTTNSSFIFGIKIYSLTSNDIPEYMINK